MKEKAIRNFRRVGSSASKISVGSFVLAGITFFAKVGLNALSNFLETGTNRSQAQIDAEEAREKDICDHRKQAIDAAEQNRVFLQEKAKAEAEIKKWAVEQAESKKVLLREKAKLQIESEEDELREQIDNLNDKISSLTDKNELLNNRIEALKEKDDYIKELKENNESLKKKISAMANA